MTTPGQGGATGGHARRFEAHLPGPVTGVAALTTESVTGSEGGHVLRARLGATRGGSPGIFG